MGGQNHQPCSNYLDLSTLLSKLVSLVTANMQLANVSLEDVLLAELNGEQKNLSLNSIITFLSKAKEHLCSALSTSLALRDRMHRLEYTDLPPLHELDLMEIGRVLSARGIVEQGAWNKMSSLMQNGTFYANLDLFDTSFKEALDLVSELIDVFKGLKHKEGAINVLVEKNQDGNFKEAFARMFTHWLHFQQEFLASSLVSTEVYYSSISVGSLCSQETSLT